MKRIVRLPSGRWYARVERDAGRRDYLYLSHAAEPGDSMRVRLPFSWRTLDDDAVTRLAREPEVRLWTDEHGIQWRVSVVGPDSPTDTPFEKRHLVFDSAEAWAGTVRFPEGHLGELDSTALRELRDGIVDLGGGRRSFRPPHEQGLERWTPTFVDRPH